MSAYDNKNKYPDPSENRSPDVSEGGAVGGKSVKDRAIDWLRTCRVDMATLQADRAKYDKYYKSQKRGDEIEGRSQVVMSDVQDTIESLMPSMMRIFYGGQDILNIRPQGIEDETKAKLMEEKVNFDLQKGLNGFKLLYQFIKDSLLYKMGVVKYYWIDEIQKIKKTLVGLTYDEYTSLASNPTFEMVSVKMKYDGREIKEKDIKSGIVVQDVFLGATYDVKGYEIKRISKPYAENLPPEEFVFDIHSRSLDESFCAHKKRIHKNKLKKYGLSEQDVSKAMQEWTRFADESTILDERFKDLGGIGFAVDPKDGNYVFIYECYLNDFDEDGNEVPKIVTIFGDKELKVEDNTFGKPPFVVMSPIIISHRLCGRGMAELALDVQDIHTVIMRNVLDSVYFQNNGMKIVNPFRIDVDSLLNGNRPGGIAFTKFDIEPQSAIFPVPMTPLPPFTKDLIEYVSVIKENRTGVTRYNQGLDSKTLNKTATGISQIMSAAQQRIELIARIFAETGVKDLYQAFVDMNIKFFDEEVSIKINQDWQRIRPQDIDGDFDVLIDVGIGTGSKEIAFNQKVQMINLYGNIANVAGVMTPMVFTVENVKNILRSMWEDLGYKNTNMYLAPDNPNVDSNMQRQMMMIQAMEGGDGGGQGAQGATNVPTAEGVGGAGTTGQPAY